MKTFSVTFGQKYHNEPHPVYPLHPDGWLVIEAPSESIAREFLGTRIGDQWSFIYEGSEPESPELYPRGVLAVWEA